MGKRKGKYYDDYYSSGDEQMENDTEEKINARKELEKYNINDYLECPETKQLLETEFYLKFETELSEKLKGLYENFCFDKNLESSNIMSKDYDGIKNNTFFSLIYKVIEKQYDLNIFYNEPSLAFPMIASKKKNIDNTEQIIENRKNSKTINNKFDWNKKEFC
jgi:hypothetical protein